MTPEGVAVLGVDGESGVVEVLGPVRFPPGGGEQAGGVVGGGAYPRAAEHGAAGAGLGQEGLDGPEIPGADEEPGQGEGGLGVLPGVANLPGHAHCLLQRGPGVRVAERPQGPPPYRHQVGQGGVGGGLGAVPDGRLGEGHGPFG